MAGNQGSLLDLAKFCFALIKNKLPSELGNAKAIAVANVIISDLAYNTPADTGTAISNWQVTLDAEAEEEVAAFVPSPKGSVTRGAWAHKVDPFITTQANAPLVIAAAHSVLRNKQPGQIIFITNNLSYINELNLGSSLQTPGGFVERARILAAQVVAIPSSSVVIE